MLDTCGSLDLSEDDLYEEESDADILSFQEPGMPSESLHEVDEPPSGCSATDIFPFPFHPRMGSPVISSSIRVSATSEYALCDWSLVPVKPINPTTAFPREYDNDVGGVLIMLLEPVIVEANVEDTDDEDEEVEADMGFGALGIICLESNRESDLLAGR